MEKPVKFENQNQYLYGILHEPEGRPADTLIIFLHGWGSYRIGPHRLFVEAARQFCRAGYACLRFDFRGRGESKSGDTEIVLADMISDAEQAAVYAKSMLGYQRIIYLGLCSGGEVAAASAAEADGLILWSSPMLGATVSTASAAQKTATELSGYRQKLLFADTWKKLLRFQVNFKGILKVLFGHLRNQPAKSPLEQNRLKKFLTFSGNILFIYGENDSDTRDARNNYNSLCSKHKLNFEMQIITEANHNFYSLQWKQEVINHTLNWLQKQQEQK